MPLFGSRTEVEISLDRESVVAGEAVAASVDVGELDKKAQGIRIEIGYRNTYKEDDTDSDGDRSTTTSKVDVVVESVPVEAQSGVVPATLAVPADAPGSAPGSVEWFVRAVVDRKRGRDASATKTLEVAVPLGPLESWSTRAPEADAKCPMELTASSRVVRPGDAITGTLTLSPREEIKARAVRVQLRRVRFDPDRNTDEDDSARVELCGETTLTPGSSPSFEFTLPVPPGAPPSFRAANNEQHWYLEGVVDVKRAGDPTSRVEVVVVTA